MDYFRLTWSYLFKNGKGRQFIVFAALALIPCAIFAYFYPLSNFIGWIANYYQHSVPSWNILWLGVFPVSLKGYFLIAFASSCFVFAEAAISTMISRHLRVGRFSTKGIFLSANENFFPALFSCLGFIFSIIIMHTILSLFLFLWLTIKIKILGLIFSCISITILVTLFIYMWATTNLWLPIMSFNGLNVFKSFSVAFYKSRINQKKFFITYIVVIGIVVGFAFAAHYARIIPMLPFILTTISYVFASVFIIAFNFISYFKAESIPREDLACLYKSK